MMIHYRLATQKDAANIAQIYYEAFKETLSFTILGENAVEQFYECFIKTGKAVVMVAEDDNRLIGFRAVSLDENELVRSMIKNNLWLFCKTGVKMLFTKTAASFKFLLNWIRYSRQIEGKEAFAKNHGYAVVKSYRGMGIGSTLALTTEEYLKSLGVKRIETSAENVGEINLLKYMGYEITHEFTYYPNRKMYYLVKEFKNTPQRISAN